MRELIALDTAEATTDPTDSSAGTAGDRSPNHTCAAGGHTVLSAGTQRWSQRRRTCRRRTRRTLRRDVAWAQTESAARGRRNASERDAQAQLNLAQLEFEPDLS